MRSDSAQLEHTSRAGGSFNLERTVATVWCWPVSDRRLESAGYRSRALALHHLRERRFLEPLVIASIDFPLLLAPPVSPC